MKFTLPAVCILVFATGVSAQHDLEEIPVSLAPEVGDLVTSPAPVCLLVPMDIGFLDLETARLDQDGWDVTPALWHCIAARPQVLSPRFRGVEVRAALALAPGEHRLRFRVRNRTGYWHEAWTRFTVISEQERLSRAGVWLPGFPLADITPPVLTFEPVQNAFVRTRHRRAHFSSTVR